MILKQEFIGIIREIHIILEFKNVIGVIIA